MISQLRPPSLAAIDARWLGRIQRPGQHFVGAPGATARLSTGLGVGAMPPWASAQTGKNMAPNDKDHQPMDQTER